MAYDLIKVSALPETTPSESQDIVIGEGDYLKRINYGDVKADMVGTAPDITTNTEPYILRTVTDAGIIGKEFVEKIVGGSVAWNQLNPNDRTTGSSNSVSASKDANGVWTLTGTASPSTALINPVTTSYISLEQGHAFYLVGCPSGGTVTTYQLDVRKDGNIVNGAIDVGNGKIFKTTVSGNHSINMRVASGATVSGIKYTPQLFDLTQTLGTTIADYLYTLESDTAGAGVAKLKEWGFYTSSDFNAHDAGSIQSVTASSHDIIGKNLLDVTKETSGSTTHIKEYSLPDIPTGTYTVSATCNSTSTYNCAVVVIYMDGTNTTTQHLTNGSWSSVTLNLTKPVKTLRIYSANNYANSQSATVTVSSAQLEKGSTATSYEPCPLRSYPLDSDLVLRGVPKLVSNKLVYDGDTYEPSGKVTRKYGIVDMGSLSWTYYSASTWFYTNPDISDIKPVATVNDVGNLVCGLYTTISRASIQSASAPDRAIAVHTTGRITVRDTRYTDATTFTNAMSGVYLVYELATPTTETADPYQRNQTIVEGGMEQFVTTGVVPVGHETNVPNNIMSALTLMAE